jgi:hypothetical protein
LWGRPHTTLLETEEKSTSPRKGRAPHEIVLALPVRALLRGEFRWWWAELMLQKLNSSGGISTGRRANLLGVVNI